MIVDFSIKNLHISQNSEEIPILITLSENSIGPRASCEIKSAGLGFDWEHNQFRIQPTDELVHKENRYLDVKPVKCKQYDGRKYYVCSICQQKISKNDRYCRYCGQKLK